MIKTNHPEFQLLITKESWIKAGEKLLAMAIAELAYEDIIQLTPVEANKQGLQDFTVKFNHIHLTVTAYQKKFGGWIIYDIKSETDPAMTYQVDKFFVALCQTLEMQETTKAYLIKEINHTWLAEAHLYNEDRPSSETLCQLSGSIVESELRGHPWIIMGKGRLGFGYHDYQQFVPEMKQVLTLPWFAIHKSIATFSAIEALTSDDVYANVLGADQWVDFKKILADKGLVASDYLFLPIHPWQWHHWISLNYGEQILNNHLVYLELSEHQYLPLQSIRTFADVTNPSSFNIKLPLNILNTAVYRGLPNERNKVAPQITQWLINIYQKDKDLQKTGLVLLGEVATVTAQQPTFDDLDSPPYQFVELLGCLFRESVENHVEKNEKFISQATLIHHDKDNNYLLPFLIEASGLTVKVWLNKFFEVCVTPLLYWLYRYGLVFSPHGENSLLIHENGVPKRMVLKDFVDDINLVEGEFEEQYPKPQEADVLLTHAPKDLSHFIFTGLFVVHYRYLFDVLHLTYQLSEGDFWGELVKVIDKFHQDNPQFKDRIAMFDLKRPTFEKVCLNRVRFFTRGYQDDAHRPVPVIAEPMLNPLCEQFFQHSEAQL